MQRMSDWDKWKKTLSQAVDMGNMVGMGDDTIVKLGSRIGDFLDNRVDPENHQQRVIKELWDVASEDEQRSLTKMLVRMVKNDDPEG